MENRSLAHPHYSFGEAGDSAVHIFQHTFSLLI
jgi:hypothetical protein